MMSPLVTHCPGTAPCTWLINAMKAMAMRINSAPTKRPFLHGWCLCWRRTHQCLSNEPFAKFIERGEFSLCSRGWSGRRSGRRGPELRDAEDLIDRECHHAEHEVAFDLDRAAHAHGPCAEFILQSGVDAFGQGAKIKNDVVRIGHMDEFHALDFFGPFGLGFVLGAKVAIDDRRMAERLAV